MDAGSIPAASTKSVLEKMAPTKPLVERNKLSRTLLMGATWLRHGTPTRQAAREMTDVIGIKAITANDENFGMKKAA